MGHRGSGVGFAEPDRGDARGEYIAARERLGSAIDRLVESDMRVEIAWVRRLHSIDDARLQFEASEEMVTGTNVASGSTFASRDLARRALTAEIATALRLPERTAGNLIETARVLIHELPATLLAVAEGRAGQRHAQILVDNVIGLDAKSRLELESRMLPVAEKKTPPQFDRAVRRTRERLNPETMVERHERAVQDRSVWFAPDRDGVGDLISNGPAVSLLAMDARLTDIARSLQGEEESRTLPQLKFDVLCDLVLDVAGQDAETPTGTTAGQGEGPMVRYRSIRPRVMVTVPALSLLKISGAANGSGAAGAAGSGADQPGELQGYGPIDPQTCREIASLADHWLRLLTDPVTATVLRLGREKYRPSEAMRLWLQVRDGTCRFPGCSRSAYRCDLDHTNPWYAARGDTDHDNLGHLCRWHHMLKHHTAWEVTQHPGGILRWTSPAGITHETEPEVRLAS